MAATAEATKVIEKTSLEQSNRTGATTTEGQKLFQEGRQKNSKELFKEAQEKGKGIDDAKRDELVGSYAPEPPQITNEDVDRVVLESAGTPGALDADEARLQLETGFNDAQGYRETMRETVDFANRYVKEGFAALDDDEKKLQRDEFVAKRLAGFPGLSEYYHGLPDDAAREDFVDGIFSQGDAQLEGNRILHEVANINIDEVVEKRITDSTVRRFRDANPHIADDAKAREQLRSLYKREEQDKLAVRLNNIVVEAAVGHIRTANRVADELNQAAIDKEIQKTKAEAADVQKKEDAVKAEEGYKLLIERWMDKQRGKDDLNDDFEILVQKGLEGVIGERLPKVVVNPGPPPVNGPGPEARAILNNPEMKTKYEALIAQAILSRRMRNGKLKNEDFDRLIDASWCGREKLVQFVSEHKSNEKLRNELKREGISERGFWGEVARLPKSDLAKFLMALMGVGMAGVALGPLSLAVAPSLIAGAGGALGTGGYIAHRQNR